MSGSDDEDGTAGPSTSKGKEKNGSLLFEFHIKNSKIVFSSTKSLQKMQLGKLSFLHRLLLENKE